MNAIVASTSFRNDNVGSLMETVQLIPPVFTNQTSSTNATGATASFENVLASQILYGILLGIFLMTNFLLRVEYDYNARNSFQTL